jgi:pyruvate-formate lyase-activating enzyme
MTVLLGAVSKYDQWKNYDDRDRVWIHQYQDGKKGDKNQFYVLYYAEKNGKSYKIPSPLFSGTYADNERIKEIAKWIKSIGGEAKAQYVRLIDNHYKLANFKRSYKAK